MSFFCVIFVAKETEMEKKVQSGAKKDTIKKKTAVEPKKAPRKRNQPTQTISKKGALLEAMRKNLGNIKASCEQLKISRNTFYRYYDEDEEFKKDIDSIGEDALDFVESKLFERIKGYSHDEDKIFIYEGNPIVIPTVKHYAPDTTAIIFYLKTKGKKRGYIETQEVVNKNAPIDPFEGKTEEEIDEMLREIEEEEKKDAQRIREFKKIEDPIDDETDDDRT